MHSLGVIPNIFLKALVNDIAESYLYYVGSKEKYDNTKEFIIPEGRYVIFSSNSRKQKDIVKTEKMIYTQWLQSTNYDINDEFNFELYTRDNCYLYMLIKDKQN